MNYEKIYSDIIDRAIEEKRSRKEQYYEKHHIKPKSLGGSNKPENIVLLKPREHFICHLLLINIFKNKDHYSYLKMLRAFMIMKSKNRHQENRYVNSRIYESIKKRLYGPDGELSGKNSTFYGRKHSEITKNILSENRYGCSNPMFEKTPWNKDKKLHYDVWNKGKKLGPTKEETKIKLSIKAKENGFGKIKTDIHKNSIRETLKTKYESDQKFRIQCLEAAIKGGKKTKGVKKEVVKCEHCGKVGGKPAMTRFHLENCKERK